MSQLKGAAQQSSTAIVKYNNQQCALSRRVCLARRRALAAVLRARISQAGSVASFFQSVSFGWLRFCNFARPRGECVAGTVPRISLAPIRATKQKPGAGSGRVEAVLKDALGYRSSRTVSNADSGSVLTRSSWWMGRNGHSTVSRLRNNQRRSGMPITRAARSNGQNHAPKMYLYISHRKKAVARPTYILGPVFSYPRVARERIRIKRRTP